MHAGINFYAIRVSQRRIVSRRNAPAVSLPVPRWNSLMYVIVSVAITFRARSCTCYAWFSAAFVLLPTLSTVPFLPISIAVLATAASLILRPFARSRVQVLLFNCISLVSVHVCRSKCYQSVCIRLMLSCIEELFKVVRASFNKFILCPQTTITSVSWIQLRFAKQINQVPRIPTFACERQCVGSLNCRRIIGAEDCACTR